MADEDKGWSWSLLGTMAYNKLVDCRDKHSNKIWNCGRTKRWSHVDLLRRVAVVLMAWKWLVRLGDRNVLQAQVR